MDKFYKAVDSAGLSFFPFKQSDRVNWIDLIGSDYALGNDEAWEAALAKLRAGQSLCCTEHLLHGYADINLALDYGQRQADDRPDQLFRIIEFEGDPVAQMEGALLLSQLPWNSTKRERFPNPVKYGFRSVTVLREVPEAEWPN